MLDITFNGDLYCKINDSKYKIEKSTDITINLLYDVVYNGKKVDNLLKEISN